MLARLLLDDSAETAGNGTESKVDEKTTVVESKSVVDPNKVTLDRSAYDADKTELDRLRKEEKDRADAIRKANEDKAREKGEYDKIIASRDKEIEARDRTISDRDERYRGLERATAAAIAERDLATTLPPNIVEGAKPQLMILLGRELEAKREGETFVTKARDGRSVADFVKAELAKPEYAHFILASTKGGAGSNGSTAAPTNKGDADQPKTLGHAYADIVLRARPPGAGVPFGSKFLEANN